MNVYEITNTASGACLGTYEGETADDAIRAMLTDAYCSDQPSNDLTATKVIDSPTLATIELDGDAGRGELFWSAEAVGIACRLPGGEVQGTETGCSASEAEDTIQAAWGGPHSPWGLQWMDD